MNFQFATSNKIMFSAGALKNAASLVENLGSKALVVTGRSIERVIPLLEQLQVRRIKYAIYSLSGEPTLEHIHLALEKAKDANVDVIISFGGGSAIDAAKAVAALMTNPGEVLDYLEVIGKGKALTHAPLPHIAIPTTAGTGTEVTKNAVLRSVEHGVKVSLRHDLIIPTIAIIDPDLTLSMPPAVTASTGMDALTQVIEPFVCNQTNPLTDAICREGIARAGRSLQSAFENGGDKNAREDMAVVSLFGGMALANAKLGAVHGFAGPIGGMFDAPHGMICARLLPFVVETNIKALQNRKPDSPALVRYSEMSTLLTGDEKADIAQGIARLAALCENLKILPLSAFGMSEDDINTLVAKAQKASSMKGNPIKLTEAELADILAKAL